MKLSIIILAVILTYNVCESKAWFPNILYERVANHTSQFTNYVREKGKNLKSYVIQNYEENVKKRIKSYFKPNTDEFGKVVINKKVPMDPKYKNRINQQNTPNKQVTHTFASKAMKYNDNSAGNDPRLKMTTLQLIASYGYRSEAHTVVTEDGYILQLHRIPYSNNTTFKVSPRKTVLLHHGLLGSSADWVLAGPKNSLAFILSEAGYDVWLANVRGNTYSRAHVDKSADSAEFWNFSFHEVGLYDLPAIIDYIKELKGGYVKINYIGHSMGTTVLFALLSTKTEYNHILNSGIALAPVAYMRDIKSPLKYLAEVGDNLEYLLRLLGTNEFLPESNVLRWLSEHMCTINNFEKVICENSLFVLCGHDAKEFNKSLLPMILRHVPAGASTKTLIHYAQEIRANGKFQLFDYGPDGNPSHYNNDTAPEYPVSQITLPIALFSGQNDWLSSVSDARKLYSAIKNPLEHYVVPLEDFNHIDFLWAIHAPILVYDKVLEVLNRVESGKDIEMEKNLINFL